MQESRTSRNALFCPASKETDRCAAFHFPSGEHGDRPLQGTVSVDHLEGVGFAADILTDLCVEGIAYSQIAQGILRTRRLLLCFLWKRRHIGEHNLALGRLSELQRFVPAMLKRQGNQLAAAHRRLEVQAKKTSGIRLSRPRRDARRGCDLRVRNRRLFAGIAVLNQHRSEYRAGPWRTRKRQQDASQNTPAYDHSGYQNGVAAAHAASQKAGPKPNCKTKQENQNRDPLGV